MKQRRHDKNEQKSSRNGQFGQRSNEMKNEQTNALSLTRSFWGFNWPHCLRPASHLPALAIVQWGDRGGEGDGRRTPSRRRQSSRTASPAGQDDRRPFCSPPHKLCWSSLGACRARGKHDGGGQHIARQGNCAATQPLRVKRERCSAWERIKSKVTSPKSQPRRGPPG